MICKPIAFKRIFKTSFECINRGDDCRVAWALFKPEKGD
jgi:hypothetical protein